MLLQSTGQLAYFVTQKLHHLLFVFKQSNPTTASEFLEGLRGPMSW